MMEFIDGSTGKNKDWTHPGVQKYLENMTALGDEYVVKVQHSNMERLQEFLHNHKLRLPESAQQELLGWVNTMHFTGIFLGRGMKNV